MFNRPYLPSDTEYVLRLAHRITAAAGRKRVAKNGVKLEAGMDTFIWQSKPPHRRPSKAFKSTPYTEEDWKTAFPDGTRRLLNCRERQGAAWTVLSAVPRGLSPVISSCIIENTAYI